MKYLHRLTYLFVGLISACATVQVEPNSDLSSIANSFCFKKSYGGYLLHTKFPDGKVRLTATVSPALTSIGQKAWGLELILEHKELVSIWSGVISKNLTLPEQKSLAKYCNSTNLDVGAAMSNDALNSVIRFIHEKNKPNQEPLLMKISEAQRLALAEFKSDEAAQVAYKKLNLDVDTKVREKFYEISYQRARHIPFNQFDQFDEAARKRRESALLPNK